MEKIPILLILLGHTWVDAFQGILPVVLVKLKELFALTYFQAGLAMAVLNITSSVIQPVFGYISDRIGRRRVMIASMLLFPLFMSFMLMSSGLWLWVLAGASGAALLASFSVTTVWLRNFCPGT